jgi:hypothetical protein
MKNKVIHALPLAVSYHGAHFYDLRASAQDYGDHVFLQGYLGVVSGDDELFLLIIFATLVNC